METEFSFHKEQNEEGAFYEKHNQSVRDYRPCSGNRVWNDGV